ncbi:XRE family transcriptional regulator [Actinomyces gaoshouyii]|uniref:XRE family transcriptional regulator n=1 Tax=Actinomyces gaoshouyii TaxID=1960083 RepID=UPI0013DDA874|nr:XRE family transcriptional regulator [Actinomyces gaoshouyii]
MASSEVFLGHRLRALADIECLTVTRLAEELGVSQGYLSKLIKGTVPVPARVVERAMRRYQLPLSFFSVEPRLQDFAAATFRKRSTSRVREDRRVSALLTEASRLWHSASERSGYFTRDLPDPDAYDGDIELTAQALRDSEGLGSEDPVLNLTRLAERHGVAVVNGLDPDAGDDDTHSGVSRPSRHEDRPLIATVAAQPGAVARMTLAHELGHIVFDDDLATPPSARDMEERRAFRFAGALLLPEDGIRRHITPETTLQQYLRVKALYGVSVGAILHRAKELGVIGSDRYRSLTVQLNSRGWRSNEPVDVPMEKPVLLTQSLQRAWPVNTSRAASEDTGVAYFLVTKWAHLKEAPPPSTSFSNVVTLHSRRPSNRY